MVILLVVWVKEQVMVRYKNTSRVKYQNGNYTVSIDLNTGTKIRENDLDYFKADFPESMDV